MLTPTKIILYIFAFFVLVSVMTFPLIFNLTQAIPGFQSTDESYAVLRYFWWFKYAFMHHLPVDHDSMQAYPFGAKYYSGVMYLGWFHLTRFLSILTNEILTYNLTVLANLVLAGTMMFLLAYYLTRNKACAFFAGAIYSLCPYQFARVWQHFALTFTQWMPLYILSLLKIFDSPKKKIVLTSALCYFLVVFFEFHYALFMGVATCVFFIYALVHTPARSRKAILRAFLLLFALILVSTVIITSPLIYSYLQQRKTALPSAWSNSIRPFNDLFVQSARPLSYFLPALTHPIFGKFTQFFIGSSFYGTSLTEHTLYLGWIPLILAFVAVKRSRQAVEASRKQRRGFFMLGQDDFYIRFFALLAVAAWICSQPPWWNIFGFKLYMPSFFLYKLLPMVRAYCRFGILVELAVAVLAGFGLRYILQGKKKVFAGLVSGICMLLVFFEFLNFPPFKIIKLNEIPQVYLWCKGLPQGTIIAEYPLDIEGTDPLYLFYQTRHEKRTINGTIPGTPGHTLLSKMRNLSEPATIDWLSQIGVRYILVHTDRYRQSGNISDQEELARIRDTPQLRKVRQFEGTEVFKITNIEG